MKRILTLILFSLLGLSACRPVDFRPSDENPYQLRKPDHFPEILYNTESNPISQAGFELGKKLFNDPILSIDQSVACSNCHVKSVAFTDPQHNPSVGVFEREGTRNAPSTINMAFMGEFLWDGGISHLDFIPPFAIENEAEMDESLQNVVLKLRAHSVYPDLFGSAFPAMDSITAPFLQKALSQYQLLLISDQSRYDKVIRGETFYDVAESEGMQIFESKCSSCHSGALQTNMGFMNNGLDSVFKDHGRELITETALDRGKFKVPSLRNVALTDPYMHDGRFKTLREVLNHYGHGVRQSPTLAEELKESNGITLSESEKDRLILFLESLTDYELISNPIF